MDGKINVINIVGPFVMGGAENMVYELAKAYKSEEVNSLVISIGNRKGTFLEQKIDDANIRIVYAECSGTVTPLKLYKVYKIIKGFKPNIIHAHMSGVVYSLPWILTHRCKMIVTAHTTPKEAFNSRVTKILKFLSVLNKVVIVGVSEENAKLMKSFYNLDDKHVKCVNNGVDVSRYYNKDHEMFTFVHVGRQDDNKNQSLIIRCFAKVLDRYPNTKLILCGDGPLRSNLESLVKDLDIEKSVLFTGNVCNVQDYLAVSDAYLQSSHREGLPLSVVEGMASSLPIISTNVGGMKNVVKDNGILIQDNDEDGYLHAMMQIRKNEELRKKMGAISLEMTNPFSSKTMAHKYLEIYKDNIRYDKKFTPTEY